MIGSALLMDVKIDDYANTKLSNGEEQLFLLEDGKHKIFASFDNSYDKLEFEIFVEPPYMIVEKL